MSKKSRPWTRRQRKRIRQRTEQGAWSATLVSVPWGRGRLMVHEGQVRLWFDETVNFGQPQFESIVTLLGQVLRH